MAQFQRGTLLRHNARLGISSIVLRGLHNNCPAVPVFGSAKRQHHARRSTPLRGRQSGRAETPAPAEWPAGRALGHARVT